MEKDQPVTTPTEQPPIEPAPESAPAPAEPQPQPEAGSEPQPESTPAPKKNTTPLIIAAAILLTCGVLGAAFALIFGRPAANDEVETDESSEQDKIDGTESLSHQLQDFDLSFLRPDEAKNAVYSPLSIKYALGMLKEGSKGETKQQIGKVIGSYIPKEYTNNEHMSFADAMFIKDTYKDYIVDSYLASITGKYNAEVIYDPFTTPDNINSWISNKTFGLVKNMFDDATVHDMDYTLVNALAIDMEWNQKIQSYFNVGYSHIDYSRFFMPFEYTGTYNPLDFDNASSSVKSLEIGAVANKYNIINELGEDNIRETVGTAYEQWLADGAKYACGNEPDTTTFINEYMEELGNGGYGDVRSSTDFYFYDDADTKVFAKDLQTYDGTTLQYVGIMPKTTTLGDYIKGLKAKNVSTLISKLKPIEADSFKDGVLTEIVGYIPVFNFDYEINLKDALPALGITDVFIPKKADISDLTSLEGAAIDFAVHKANIDFSNDGIKAAAVTAAGGLGAAGCGFEYDFEIPVETIDLTFDSPYLFLIRDKDSGEVWFTGAVYQPTAM